MKVQIYLILIIVCIVQSVFAKEDAPKPESTIEQVIEPDIYRRDINVPRIDTENFEITAYYGLLDVEDFGAESTVGVRVAYHITEDFFRWCLWPIIYVRQNDRKSNYI